MPLMGPRLYVTGRNSAMPVTAVKPGTEPKIMPTMTPRIINASVSGVAIAAMPSIKRSNM